MRGSPLIRFILLTLALVATGLGLARVTAARNHGDPVSPPVGIGKPLDAGKSIPFRLLLSAPAVEVGIDTGKPILLPVDGSPISGTLELDPQNPHVGLIVRWKNPALPGEHRFAKLTLEAPGQETFNHVFDADGDIDDFLELPFPEVK